MALLFQAFDAATVAPQDSFDCLPAGIYNAQATDSEVKSTKAGNGTILAFTFTVLDGQFTGRKVFCNLNIANPNRVAEEIAQKQLSQFCHAAGVLQVKDSAQLHNRPVKIKVKIKKDDQYGDKNEISAFEAIKNGVSPAAPASFAPPPQPARAPAAAPWGAR
ncbi:MAG: DUF669 domain-containing protein [Candidatus Accumulibacter sp.]|nr:DUF669 domain-containing protein [Accumulibacter sp.]